MLSMAVREMVRGLHIQLHTNGGFNTRGYVSYINLEDPQKEEGLSTFYIYPDGSVLKQFLSICEVPGQNIRMFVLRRFAERQPPVPKSIVEYNKFGMEITKIWDCSCGRRPCTQNAHGRD